MNDQQSPNPTFIWDIGTAYDFFASLTVLHHPAKFGLRGAWAAGVRSRLGQEEREFLETLYEVEQIAYGWVHSLPEPKDGETLLYHLKHIPAKERAFAIFGFAHSESVEAILRVVSDAGQWTDAQRDDLIAIFKEWGESIRPNLANQILTYFADGATFGERLLAAFQMYYEVFFAEEEKRIQPKLEAALAEAQAQAKTLSGVDLLEKISHGVRYETERFEDTLVIAPSYWLSPLVMRSWLTEDTGLYVFGARPLGESLVPGEIVPDDLLTALKALADPTRLRILRYLMQEQLTPAELSRRLRLRAPTVTHHLHALRLAGLVRFAIKGKHERLYSARLEAIQMGYTMLKEFLEQDANEVEDPDPFDRGQAL